MRLNVSGSVHHTKSISQLPLSVGGTTVPALNDVLNLGFTFDSQLTMRNHVDRRKIQVASFWYYGWKEQSRWATHGLMILKIGAELAYKS